MRSLCLPLLLLLAATTAPLTAVQGQDNPGFRRTEDLIYGRKFGTALTLDVFEPTEKNGCAVILVVSGGFFSAKESINPGFCAPFLKRGYTVFAVVHGSQPRFIIPEIQQDLHRATRWIRSNAARWGVKPDKFAVFGASAGGHLSLTLGTQGGPGKSDARDPIDRESSGVQAVACFFPPTDFANWGESGEDACGVGRLKDFKPAFGARSDTAESRANYSREISPLYFVTAKTAPTLIIHGDADKLVPIYQAQIFEKKLKEAGVPAQVVVRPGKEHGWPGIDKDLELFADWFDQHLRGIRKN
jgi:acetyl esterase/lipase